MREFHDSMERWDGVKGRKLPNKPGSKDGAVWYRGLCGECQGGSHCFGNSLGSEDCRCPQCWGEEQAITEGGQDEV